jgi:transketolase
LQISGKTEQVMSLEPLRDRWEQFGWEVEEVDGHDIEAMINLFDRLLATPSSKPHLIISHTVKGKGVSFMENVAGWHHGVPSEAQYRQAIQEIEATLAALNG